MQWKHPRSPSTKKLRQQSKDFYAAGFDALVEQWDMCGSVGGGYVEKCFFQVHILHVLGFISFRDLFTDSPSYYTVLLLLVHVTKAV
jgi:hypothetical protein